LNFFLCNIGTDSRLSHLCPLCAAIFLANLAKKNGQTMKTACPLI